MAEFGRDALPRRDEVLIARLATAVDTIVRPYFRAEVRGVDRIPAGPALFVSNHNAGLLAPEALLLCATVQRRRGLADVPYLLAGDLVVALPAVERALVQAGIVRARLEASLRLLAGGAKVLVFPGGDLEAMRPWRDRHRIVFGGRRGYVRLALRAGVPVLPVVAAGAHSTFIVLSDGRRLVEMAGIGRRLRLSTWPIALCLPWGLLIGPAQSISPGRHASSRRSSTPFASSAQGRRPPPTRTTCARAPSASRRRCSRPSTASPGSATAAEPPITGLTAGGPCRCGERSSPLVADQLPRLGAAVA